MDKYDIDLTPCDNAGLRNFADKSLVNRDKRLDETIKMADNLNVLKKAKKITLPAGWVERFSKKHPDRPFYFNEKTGESRWSPPLDEPEKVRHCQCIFYNIFIFVWS